MKKSQRNAEPAPLASPFPSPTFPDPIPGVIRFGTVTLLGGEARVGKSPLLLEWCARWRDGRTIFGRKTNPPTAFYYIATDRGWADSYQHWADLVGFPDINQYALADDNHFNLDNLANEKLAHASMIKVLDRVNPIPGSYVVVDAVSPLFITGDPNKSRNVAVAVHRYRRECHKRQISLFGCVHHAKQINDSAKQYKRLIDRMSGSGAFAGYSDCQLSMVGPSDTEPWHTFEWNPPHEPATQFKLQRLDNGLFGMYNDVFTDSVTPEVKPEALALLALIPEEGEISTTALIEQAAAELRISPATAYRYLQHLEEALRVERSHGKVRRRKVN